MFLDEPYALGWAWDDLQWSYGAPVSALSFNENADELNVDQGSASSGHTRGHLGARRRLLHARQHHESPLPPAKKPTPASNAAPASQWFAHGVRFPPKGLHASLAVEDPAEFTADAFKLALLGRGIKVSGEPESRHQLRPAPATLPRSARSR